MRSALKNHHIRTGAQKGNPKGKLSDKWPKGLADYLRETVHGATVKQQAELARDKFGIDITPKQVKAMRLRLHLKSGLTGRYGDERKPQKWIPPEGWVMPENQKRTTFKAGQRPHNACNVGDLRKTTPPKGNGDGYWKRKMGEPNRWIFEHIRLWEEANGPVPDDHYIIFLDGNHDNLALDNLMCVSKAAHGLTNNTGGKTEYPELTKACVLAAEIKIKRNKLRRG